MSSRALLSVTSISANASTPANARVPAKTRIATKTHLSTKTLKVVGLFAVGTLAGCLTKALWSVPLPNTAGENVSPVQIHVDGLGNTYVVDAAAQANGASALPRVRLVSPTGAIRWENTFPLVPFGGAAGIKKEEFSLQYAGPGLDGLALVTEVQRCEYVAVPGGLPLRLCDAGRTDIRQITGNNSVTSLSLPVVGDYVSVVGDDAPAVNGIHVVAPAQAAGTAAEDQPDGVWAYDAHGELLWRHDYTDFQDGASNTNHTRELLSVGGNVIALRTVYDGAVAGYQLLALDAASGAVRWTRTAFEGGASVTNMSKDAAGHLYYQDIRDGQMFVRGLDAQGTPLWTHAFASVVPDEAHYRAGTPVVAGNHVCYAYREVGAEILARNLACLNNATGAVTLNAALPYPAKSSGNVAYTQFIDTRLTAASDGSLLVTDTASTGKATENVLFRVNPASGAGGNVVYAGPIHAVAAASGTDVRVVTGSAAAGLSLNNYSVK